ncbi:MAG: family 16 glycoside hydrolase [Prosthecobacter sp.]
MVLGGNCRLFSAEWSVITTDNLNEWSDPDKWWRTENGVIIAESKGGDDLPEIHFLSWKGSVGKDFELSLEFRFSATKPEDAGINFRIERPHGEGLSHLPSIQAELDTAYLYADKDVPNRRGFVQQGKNFGHLHDGKRMAFYRRGQISTVQPNGKIESKPLPGGFNVRKAFREPPEWNQCVIRAIGEHIQLFFNGALAAEVFDRDPKKRASGDGIALQYRPNGAYRFEVRDLKFRQIEETAAVEPKPAAGASIEESVRLALAGKLVQAAAMQEEIFAADPSALDTMGGLGLAVLYAATRDKEKHRRLCEKLFQKYANPKSPEESERPAKAYALFPGADDSQLLKEADKASARALKAASNPSHVWFELSRGIVQYRMGDYVGAAESLRKPASANHPLQKVSSLAYSAMVAFRQNDSAKARRLLSDAEKAIQRGDFTKLNWNDVIAGRVAIDEAKELIR